MCIAGLKSLLKNAIICQAFISWSVFAVYAALCTPSLTAKVLKRYLTLKLPIEQSFCVLSGRKFIAYTVTFLLWVLWLMHLVFGRLLCNHGACVRKYLIFLSRLQ